MRTILTELEYNLVNNQPPPIVDACYLDLHNNMFKVRMLSYSGNQIKSVVIEDTLGRINSLDLKQWQDLPLFPCCYTGSEPLLRKNMKYAGV